MPLNLAIRSILLITTVSIFGCSRGDGIPRTKVRGEVTHMGQPVVDGQIRFQPAQQTTAPMTIVLIKDGRYQCAIGGGVPAGTHRVKIFSFDPNVPPPQGPMDPVQPQLLPKKYNHDSELVWTLQQQRGWLTKDWDLQ